MRLKPQRTIALLLAFALSALTFVTAACDPPKREKLVKIAGYGQQLAGIVEANRSLPDDLLGQGLIDQAKRDQLATHFDQAARLTKMFNDGLRDVLANEHPSTAQLVTTVAQMIDEARAIQGLIPNGAAQRVVGGIQIALRAIANYFAVQVAVARTHGYTDAQIARSLGLRAEQSELIERIAAYGQEPATSAVPVDAGR